VYAQRPQPGDKVPRGSSVMLFVSSGRGSRTPDLVDSSLERSEQLLKDAGLRGMIAQRVPGEPADIVVAQDPAPATLLTEGSFIRLTVTAGPPGEPKDDDPQGVGGRPGDRGKAKGKGNDD
ncbi:MAG: PASTA domain-containing protein, partial [Actinomycetota bacterium]